MLPSRPAPVCGGILNFTEPFAVLFPPSVIVIQSSDAVGVQLQPIGPSTAKLPVPPSASNFWLLGCRSNWQVNPSCTTSRVRPPVVTVPRRTSAVGLAATT